MKRLAIFLLPLFVLGSITLIIPVRADTLLYSHFTTNTSTGNFYDGVESTNPNWARAAGEFVTSGWTGQALTSITLDLAWDSNDAPHAGCTPTGSYTIGVFDMSDNLVSTFGSALISSLPKGGLANPVTTFARVTFAGSHILAANEYVGFTANDPINSPCGTGVVSTAIVMFTCEDLGGGCNISSHEPNGMIISHYPDNVGACGDYCDMVFNFSGQFFVNNGSPPPVKQSAVASAILPAAFIIIIAGLVYSAFHSEELTFKEKTRIAIGGVIAIGIIFIIFVAFGL